MLKCCRQLFLPHIRLLSTQAPNLQTSTTVEIGNHVFQRDDWTNVNPKILSYIKSDKHLQKHHPLSIVRKKIVEYFYSSYKNHRGNPIFSIYSQVSPVVSVQQNFDNLLIPNDHPSRAKSDCYYINKHYLLRAHTTAHQVEMIKSGLDNYIIVGEVYRRDEIDSTHYPVFHQLDAVRLIGKEKLFGNVLDLEIFENDYQINPRKPQTIVSNSKCIDQSKQPCHTLEAVKLTEHELKSTLVGLTKHLFGDDIQYRWVDTCFPFTQPSWELEIYHNNKWMEVLGCGIMRNEILMNSGVSNSIGFAFGLGLERLAMILFDIPDIRLFWSNDSGFLNQFNEDDNGLHKYKAISTFPQCTNDLSFWLPEGMEMEDFSPNDFYDIARGVGEDMIEQITLVDKFKHPKNGKSSLCFRIVYRHMEKTLTQAEVNDIHEKIAKVVSESLNVVIR